MMIQKIYIWKQSHKEGIKMNKIKLASIIY